MATTSALYRNPAQPVKFNREFLERRMREHKEFQQQLASEGAVEIVQEVVGVFTCFAEIRTGEGKIARMR